MPFTRKSGHIHLTLSALERSVLADLARQTEEIIRGDRNVDPALQRLFPDGYEDDREASDEFRRYTMDDLVSEKSENASRVLAALEAGASGSTDITLDTDDEQAWVRWLTDVRLTVATRLEEAASDERAANELRDVYDWLVKLCTRIVLLKKA